MVRKWMLPVVVLAFTGCEAKLTSSVTVDGKTFTAASCRSGQASGFTGVDLLDSAGQKLRLTTMPDGQAEAYVFDAGAAQGTKIGACGPFTFGTQNSTINNIKNVQGNATLDCTGGGHSVKGTVSFANCH